MPATNRARASDEVRAIGVRLPPDERARVDRVLARVKVAFPEFTHAQLVRAAIRIGVDALEQDPGAAMKRSGVQGS